MVTCPICKEGTVEVFITTFNNGTQTIYAGCSNWIACSSKCSREIEAMTEQEALDNWHYLNHCSVFQDGIYTIV